MLLPCQAEPQETWGTCGCSICCNFSMKSLLEKYARNTWGLGRSREGRKGVSEYLFSSGDVPAPFKLLYLLQPGSAIELAY